MLLNGVLIGEVLPAVLAHEALVQVSVVVRVLTPPAANTAFSKVVPLQVIWLIRGGNS